MYIVLNTAISHRWGMPEPCPVDQCSMCWYCYDCTNPGETSIHPFIYPHTSFHPSIHISSQTYSLFCPLLNPSTCHIHLSMHHLLLYVLIRLSVHLLLHPHHLLLHLLPHPHHLLQHILIICYSTYYCTPSSSDCQCTLPEGMKGCKNLPAAMEVDYIR